MSKKKGKEEQTLDEKLKMAIVPKEEEPYKVPDNWVWTRLGDITKVASGGIPSTSVEEYYKNGDIAWLSPKDLSGYTSKYISRGAKNITKKGLEKSSAVLLPKNTVLMSSRAPIGYVAISTGEISTNQGFKSFLPSTSYIPEYLYYYLIKSKLYLESIATGTTFKELSGEKAKKIIFPLPPIEEQKRIVNKLDYFFDKIQKVKEIIEEVKEKNEARKESILSKAFTGELTAKWRADNTHSAKELLSKINDEKLSNWEQECQKAEAEGRKKPTKPKLKSIDEMIVPNDEIPYKIPNNWVWTKLDNCISLISGRDVESKYCNSEEKGIPYILGASNISDNTFTAERWIENPVVISKKNDILLSVKGTIGKLYLQKEEEINISRQIMALRTGQNINSKYLIYFLLSSMEKIKLEGVGLIPGISREVVLNTFFPLPPIEEQKEIVRILDNIFTKENLINELISLEDKIQALEKSILSKAFRGELGTNSKDDIEAMELLKEIL